jgi:ribonuclease D
MPPNEHSKPRAVALAGQVMQESPVIQYGSQMPDPRRAATPTDDSLLPPCLVDGAVAFAEMLNDLRGEPVVAIDTESDSLYRYFHKVCLLQISTPRVDYLVDPLCIPDIAPLGPVFADPGVEKVFHAAENDILLLQRDFGFGVVSVFDTMLAARILGRPKVSLAGLLDERYGIKLDKHMQLTDWGHRPLTPKQLSYARLDTHFLLPLRGTLEIELRDARRWREAQEAFAALQQVSFVEKPFDPEGFWRNREARNLSPAELAVLKELYLWRDKQARSWDRPPFKVLSDEMLARLSRGKPQQPEDLPLDPRQTREFGPAILAAIARGRTAPVPAPPVRTQNGAGRPDAATLDRYDRLREWRTRRASERGVEADVVLTNQVLMSIARAAPANLEQLAALEVMGAWKLEEYGAELLDALVTDRETGPR